MRPNAIPAKDFYKNDAAQQGIENQVKRLNGRPRTSIQDLCDFCLQPRFVYRNLLSLRRKGYRFGCGVCHAKGLFKWKSEGEDQKVLPCLNAHEINRSV